MGEDAKMTLPSFRTSNFSARSGDVAEMLGEWADLLSEVVQLSEEHCKTLASVDHRERADLAVMLLAFWAHSRLSTAARLLDAGCLPDAVATARAVIEAIGMQRLLSIDQECVEKWWNGDRIPDKEIMRNLSAELRSAWGVLSQVVHPNKFACDAHAGVREDGMPYFVSLGILHERPLHELTDNLAAIGFEEFKVLSKAFPVFVQRPDIIRRALRLTERLRQHATWYRQRFLPADET